MNRRGLLLVREFGQQIWMSDYTGALLRIELHLHEIVGAIRVHPVEARQPVVHIHVVSQQQVAIIGRSVPNHVVQKQVQRRAQIRNDFRCEAGVKIVILRQIFDVIYLQPMVQKLLHLRMRPRIGQHPARLLPDLLATVQRPRGSQLR